MEFNDWISQVRRGLVEFCILESISKQPMYGYDLLVYLEQWDIISITEGTLYPLLRRLQKEEYIVSYWQESDAGPPRKYYQLTKKGEELLHFMKSTWSQLTQSIDELIQMERNERNE